MTLIHEGLHALYGEGLNDLPQFGGGRQMGRLIDEAAAKFIGGHPEFCGPAYLQAFGKQFVPS